MISKYTLIALSSLALVSACGGNAGGNNAADVPDAQPAAASSVDIGDHVVHFSAQLTNQLPLDIARAYGITRSDERAMVNVSVLKKPGHTPVTADVTVKTVNLTGQPKTITMEQITEQDAIYYIGQVRVANRETLIFDFSVTPDGADSPSIVRFQRQFYTD